MTVSVTAKTIGASWVQLKTQVREPRHTRVEFRFAPEYIRALWHPRLARESTLRGVFDNADGERLLFDDVVPIDGASMFVQAWLVPSARLDAYHIRVSISAPAPLKRSVSVRLYWDKDEYTATLSRGEWQFEDITEPNYSRKNGNLPSRRLRLSLEFGTTDA